MMYGRATIRVRPPFLIMLMFWTSTLFLGFGLLARFNPTLLAVLLVGALSVSGAILVILELHDPYSGLFRLSDAPILEALKQLNNADATGNSRAGQQ
jgi:hypothetical protein